MSERSTLQVAGALLVLVVAIGSAGVIAMGFLAPERMFEGPGLYAFFLAGALMVVCAVVANLYDLRGILAEAW